MAIFQVKSTKGTIARVIAKSPSVFRVTATHRGPRGIQGLPGVAGADSTVPGPQGDPGVGAYQDWLDQGNTGTQADFLTSLVGSRGLQGIAGLKGDPGIDGVNGSDGLPGVQGPPGPNVLIDGNGVSWTLTIDTDGSLRTTSVSPGNVYGTAYGVAVYA